MGFGFYFQKQEWLTQILATTMPSYKPNHWKKDSYNTRQLGPGESYARAAGHLVAVIPQPTQAS